MKTDYELIEETADHGRVLTDDERAFGVDTYVYCRQHMSAHKTGWCGVSNIDKLGLGTNNYEEALGKCQEFGLEIL